MKQICANCRFADFATSTTERGDCRRFAPKVTIGQLEPDVGYSHPEMAAWPGVARTDTCGEFQLTDEVSAALFDIVRERIFGDGTDASEQRVIDLCHAARSRFGVERER